MSPDELKAHARRVPEELLTQGDLAVADAVLAPDYIAHISGPIIPGVLGAKQRVVALRQAFPDLCVIIEDEIAEDDTVVQRLTYSGTHAGSFLGIPPTGNRACWRAVEIQRLGPDGKFVEHWAVADMLGVLQQLGALPPAFGARRDAADAAQGN